ncbi:MAG: DUF433 domain-containing protein [Burkholderiales bacterium]|nr:DUF433 domain-containing protein [Burkholderiales bacterium]
MTQLGLGVYNLADAARLIRIDRRSIKRWMYGYTHSHRNGEEVEQRHAAPLWSPQYTSDELGERVIGFHDLLELRVVRQFVDHGVPLQVVRRCLDTARELFGTDYPLTRRSFVTDGATIYVESIEAARTSGEIEDGHLLNLRSRQYAFKAIIKDSLYAGIEYEGGTARRWYPEPRTKAVVVDPALQFGQPIVEACGVPTVTLYTAFEAEQRDRARVARLFDVEPRHVDAAVRFECELLKAA